MGQIEVLEYIKEKDWLSSKQITEGLNHNYNSTVRSLTMLIKHRMVIKKEVGYRKYVYKSL